jgi:hypothetical protein
MEGGEGVLIHFLDSAERVTEGAHFFYGIPSEGYCSPMSAFPSLALSIESLLNTSQPSIALHALHSMVFFDRWLVSLTCKREYDTIDQ